MSYITPRSAALVRTFARAGHAKDASGAALFGPDLSEWPIWAVDAMVTLERERIAEHNARVEAELSEMQHG